MGAFIPLIMSFISGASTVPVEAQVNDGVLQVQPAKTNTALVLGLSIGGLAAVGVIAYLVLKRRK